MKLISQKAMMGWSILVLSLTASLNVFADKYYKSEVLHFVRYHSHNEPKTSIWTEPRRLNLRFTPKKGLTGDTSLKVWFKRRGGSGIACNKINQIDVTSLYYQRNGDKLKSPFSAKYTGKYADTFSACSFKKSITATLIPSKYARNVDNTYFSDICKKNIGKTINIRIPMYTVVEDVRDNYVGNSNRKRIKFQHKLSIPARLTCACIPPQFYSTELDSARVSSRSSTSFSEKIKFGSKPFRFSVNGIIPPGMRFNNTGTLSGAPTVPGEYNFTITARDSCSTGSVSTKGQFKLNVCSTSADLALPSMTLTSGNFNSKYRYQLVAKGLPPIKYSVLDRRDLPRNVSLSANGLLSGVAASTGRHRFTVVSEDKCGLKKETSLVINVDKRKGCQKLEFYDAGAMTQAQIHKAYFYKLGISGGGVAPRIQLKPGSKLPGGLVLDRNAGISGKPLKGGKFPFTLVASNQCSGKIQRTEKSFLLVVQDRTKTGYENKQLIRNNGANDRLSDRRSYQSRRNYQAQSRSYNPENKSKNRVKTQIITLTLGVINKKIVVYGKNFKRAQAVKIVFENKRTVSTIKAKLGKNVNGGREVIFSVKPNARSGKVYSLMLKLNNKWIKVPAKIANIKLIPDTRNKNNTTNRSYNKIKPKKNTNKIKNNKNMMIRNK